MEFSSPPPLFKQGASARAKVVFFALIAIALLAVDARMQSLAVLRQLLGTALYPLQAVALLPRDALYAVGGYFTSQTRLERENAELRRQAAENARALQQAQFLAGENRKLRQLLGIRDQLAVPSVTSEILYDTRDPFTRKIVLDRGSRQGVAPGQPVIDDDGVVGQVTRVFPFTAEVSLLTDKDQAIPVQVLRNGLRSVAYGRGQSGLLELRFMVANADIQNGDVLVTSGIDGVYPAGLAVARVIRIESKASGSFAQILCEPLAGLGRYRQLLVLLTEAQPLPLAAPEADGADTKEGKGAKEAPGARAARQRAKTDAAAPRERPAPTPAAPKKQAPAQGINR